MSRAEASVSRHLTSQGYSRCQRNLCGLSPWTWRQRGSDETTPATLAEHLVWCQTWPGTCSVNKALLAHGNTDAFVSCSGGLEAARAELTLHDRDHLAHNAEHIDYPVFYRSAEPELLCPARSHRLAALGGGGRKPREVKKQTQGHTGSLPGTPETSRGFSVCSWCVISPHCARAEGVHIRSKEEEAKTLPIQGSFEVISLYAHPSFF